MVNRHISRCSTLSIIREMKTETTMRWDFPGGSVVKNPPANAGNMGLSPGLGRSHVPQSN